MLSNGGFKRPNWNINMEENVDPYKLAKEPSDSKSKIATVNEVPEENLEAYDIGSHLLPDPEDDQEQVHPIPSDFGVGEDNSKSYFDFEILQDNLNADLQEGNADATEQKVGMQTKALNIKEEKKTAAQIQGKSRAELERTGPGTKDMKSPMASLLTAGLKKKMKEPAKINP
jgi:hypothetical protein